MTPLRLRIRELREKAGWSQAELARRARVGQATVSRIEAGATKGVDLQTLERLARALKVPHPGDLIARLTKRPG
jgi:transcriptional regulator with XRE-family HTH domain